MHDTINPIINASKAPNISPSQGRYGVPFRNNLKKKNTVEYGDSSVCGAAIDVYNNTLFMFYNDVYNNTIL